ncbi:DUF3310 domain-containing protein [Exiguobacterium sp. s183]|uniref:DUF3310 domain-containing protein n=1 Tax=Exiguobacterium sp. s183 TaxID=2751262 RepID=UPI001BEC039C|nr:DUF3310 domain-containing protein [Exiguobacterium sp. s183]
MNLKVGGEYLYKRTITTKGKEKETSQLVIVRRIDEGAALVALRDDENKWCHVPIEHLHSIDYSFPNIEPTDKSQQEPSKPAHYDTGIDTIAFMRANCPPEQVEGFLRGNALKYLQRYPNKNGVDDLRKAKHYVEMLIEELEGRG